MSKYIYVGSRIYYLKINGNVILTTNEGEGHLIEVTPEQDWEIYSELKKYDKEAVDYIQLEYNQYSTEFRECTGYHVDTDKKELVFEYGEKPPAPEVPVAPSLHERVDNLELGAEATQEALDMLLLANMGEPVQAATLAVSTFANTNTKKGGGDTMAAYIAMRILKKGEKSVESGRDYYVTWITHPAYGKYKADIDLILKAEGRDDLIVESL